MRSGPSDCGFDSRLGHRYRHGSVGNRQTTLARAPPSSVVARMLWVRVPPELFDEDTSSRSSLECSPPCHGGDVGSNPIEDADMARYAIWQSGECDHRSGGARPSCSVGSTPSRATAITFIARATSTRRIFVIANENASAGHWRAQVAVTHPPSGIGGSTPSRRTSSRTARSSSGSGCWPLKPATRVQIPHGSLTDMAKWCNW